MRRMQKLLSTLSGAQLDALWVTKPENVRYLSGFTTPKDGRVLITPERSILYTDARYTVQAQEESALEVVIARGPEVLAHAAEVVRGKRVGFEAEHLSVAALEDLSALEASLVPTRGLVEILRRIKTPEEIAKIRRAQELADNALQAVLPQLRAGVREIDIALELEYHLRRAGASGPSFDFIVAGGPRSAMPHGVASERVLQDGDLVTIDMGAVWDGYHSDMTRAYPVGEIREQLRGFYRAVKAALEAAVAQVRPGVSCPELDAVARGVLAEHGLAEYFAHSLGHGVGLAIHEAPSLSALSQDVLEAGMVITVEPGVYLPGVGGVRLEHLLVVTESGHEVLSASPIPEL
ncbi:M24 family metallopeptidase [Deinobacterium chartae]